MHFDTISFLSEEINFNVSATEGGSSYFKLFCKSLASVTVNINTYNVENKYIQSLNGFLLLISPGHMLWQGSIENKHCSRYMLVP